MAGDGLMRFGSDIIRTVSELLQIEGKKSLDMFTRETNLLPKIVRSHIEDKMDFSQGFPKDVKLDHEGLCRLLGHREACIMEVLWGRENVTVREIHRAISKKEEIAYTTVMTITDRLWKKGLLERYKDGKTYFYTPKSSKESFVTSCLRRVFNSFAPDMNRAALSHFVDSLASCQPELLDELENMLKERGEGE